MNKKQVRPTQTIHTYNWLRLCGILLLTFFTYYPSLKNGFTNWDDNVYIAENPLINDLSAENIKQIFDTDHPVALNYHPITILSFAIDHKLSGYDPKTYHTTNLLFHLLNTALVFWFVFLLSNKKIMVATIVALFFGIHPMHVESVAWISERKDVLYVFFFMASLICYHKYMYASGKNKLLLYFFTMALFVFSILSKAMAVVLPVVLLLIDYYLGRKLDKRSIIEKLPFFLLSLFFGILSYQIQSKGAAVAALETFTWLQRFEFASYGMLNYIFKLFIPLHLSCFYPYPDPQESLPILYTIAPFIVLALCAFVVWRARKSDLGSAEVFGFLFFFISIALVLQFITVGKVIMADRYSYLSYIGLLFPIAMGYDGMKEQTKKVLASILIIYAGVFIFLSFQRTKVWKNSDTLWSDAIDKYPNRETFHSRASYLVNKSAIDIGQKNITENEYNRALSDYSNSIQLKTLDASVYAGRANIYSLKGQFDSALTDYSKAIELNNSDAQIYLNRAGAYILMKQFDKAVIDFSAALTLDANLIEARKNRSYAYGQMGDYEKAIVDLNELIRQYPVNADYYFYRSYAHYKLGEYPLALQDNTASIQLNPDNSIAYYNGSLINKALGKYKEALDNALKAQSMGYSVSPDYMNDLKGKL